MARSTYLWLLDAGHGGIKNGLYTTAPAKMYKFSDGLTFYEGVNNRAIVDRIKLQLIQAGIDFKYIHDAQEDTPLMDRCKRANEIYEKDRRAIFLSVHSNSGGGTGNEIFTSVGETKSDKVANIFCETYQKLFPNAKFRSDAATDGDLDKEANFAVLRWTHCPALLVENFFFDNRREAEFLMSEEGQQQIACCIVQCIQNVEAIKPI